MFLYFQEKTIIMKKQLYTISLLFSAFLMLVSFSNNPPNGRTGAPGDGLCTDCHSPGNPAQDGSIEVTGFPDVIAPEMTYTLTVTVKNPNGLAELAGFQMTILDGTDQISGTMLNASDNSTVTTANNREYFEHNPAVDFPGANEVSWTVDWTAPEGPLESPVFYYAAGNVANGNSQNSGDRIVTAEGEGVISQTSSVSDHQIGIVKVFPNPASDFLHFDLGGQAIQSLQIYDASGRRVEQFEAVGDRQIDISSFTPGMYFLRAIVDGKPQMAKWIKE